MQSGVMKKAGDALQYRWRIAVAIIALALGCGVLAAELTPTQYKAEAQLYVDPTKNSVALNASDGLSNGYFTQQVTARHVVQRALASLAAAESSHKLASDLGGNPTVDQVASRITATVVKGTAAIAIDATGPTASGAANLADALAQAVIDQYRDDAAQRYVNSDQFLQGELTRLSKLINQDISPEQVASDRAQYQTTYNNFQNLQIQQVKDVGSLSITEHAQPPTKPSSPDLARDAAIALLAGLVIGGLAILLVERFDDRIHNSAELAEAAGISLTAEIEFDGAGTLADRQFALAYADMAARNPAARIFMVAGAATQDRSGPTAASLSVAAVNAGKRSIVLRAEPETASVSRPPGAEASNTTALASETLLELIQTIRASRSPKFAFLAVPSLLVSPMALTMARRVDAAVLVATARRTYAAEVKQAAEALQSAGLKVVAAILLTTPRSSGANGATPGKTKRPMSRRLVALARYEFQPRTRAMARTLGGKARFIIAGRRPAGGSKQPQPTVKYGRDPCSETACARQDGAPCEYVDRRGKKCPTAWCPEHQYVVGEAFYCRRHAGMMAALLTLPEEDRECPDLDNRAPSLLEHVARRLHQAAVQMLQEMGAEYPGSSIVVDALHVTKGGPPRVRGWEHRWRLLDHTGPLATIGIRVDEDADIVVQVKVDGVVVHTAEPPWIAVRAAASDEEETARRQDYEQELINAMFESLQRRHEFRY